MNLILILTLLAAAGDPSSAPVAPDPGKGAMQPQTGTEQKSDEDNSWEKYELALTQVPWLKESGRGIGIGYTQGLWGQLWTQSLDVRIPIVRTFGVMLRGIAIQDSTAERFDVGGRIELYGSSPPLLNLIRLYGGGGFQVFYPVGKGAPAASKRVMGGGGYFGFEFFMAQHLSFKLELGGQGGSVAPGATIMGGLMFYPF